MSASLTERMQNSSGDERILKKRLGFAVYQQIKNKQSDMNAIINNRIHYDAECTIFHKAFVVMYYCRLTSTICAHNRTEQNNSNTYMLSTENSIAKLACSSLFLYNVQFIQILGLVHSEFQSFLLLKNVRQFCTDFIHSTTFLHFRTAALNN
ncbi:putative multiple resistance and pH regulation protein F [Trichinella spiralis]|uniref:putative multiple resistance and pH regulation protein F n=1 Tax=Trichinella spiralis TaxID=6334 RepID=UPI0001EFD777|nr:putative multiple resistance and pH regulation protein F [Trichinella spiralis]